MGLTYSIMMPLGQSNKGTYQHVLRHKKSKISDTELINPVESTKEDEEKETVEVFERHVEKVNN